MAKIEDNSIGVIIKATNFAAIKHKNQRRKDAAKTPYINHPIGVANILIEGKVTDPAVIQNHSSRMVLWLNKNHHYIKVNAMPRIEPESNPFPKPSRAIYGFVAYQASYIFMVAYLIWAYVPDEILNDLGITYIPNKYWAIAVPTYIPFFIMCGIVFYIGLNFTYVPELNDPRTLGSDPYSYPAGEKDMELDSTKEELPNVKDIPIEIVNTHMFQLVDVYANRRQSK